ncbi:histidine phosphatase family protein [Undibacter mobilis]|uniref:Histidine phosphatase family protein n=1 Tax=Undibacter mobilis TaxID=2292256 RepID=A0A371B3U3_9BRAD|nr:histidine phosphatase family protein [Undibacter mobilis]RDV02266.1 histidine phosphatase family protein [Undibacter mobilis]
MRTVYYIRHGETDWNAAGRLQGHRDIPLNDKGRGQARHCGNVLRDLFAKEGRDPASLDYVSSPLLRATETMEWVREGLKLPRDGFRREPQLIELSFGDWEGATLALLHHKDPVRIAQREQDKYHFVPPNGESYRMVEMRMKRWYDTLAGDVVAAAHGGTCRGLMASLGIVHPAAAPLVDIVQGVVYVFRGSELTQYA